MFVLYLVADKCYFFNYYLAILIQSASAFSMNYGDFGLMSLNRRITGNNQLLDAALTQAVKVQMNITMNAAQIVANTYG